jgi:hydrogenase maturation protease
MAVVRVIGCGNPDAGDDGAGILAVALAREALEAIPGVQVVPEASPLSIVHLLEGAGAVVVVDAIRTAGAGRPVGALVRAEAGPRGLPAEIRSSLSSHGLGVAEAIGLAAALGPAPRVVVLGVEAAEAVAGRPLSEAVARAVPALAEMILAEAAALAAPAAGTAIPTSEAERSPAEGPTGPSRGLGPEPR